jgi:hypothetical protein
MREHIAKRWEAPSAPPTALVLGAAAWLTTQNPPPEHPIPELQGRFQLSAKEACQACTLADRLRSQRGGAHG